MVVVVFKSKGRQMILFVDKQIYIYIKYREVVLNENFRIFGIIKRWMIVDTIGLHSKKKQMKECLRTQAFLYIPLHCISDS